LYVLTGGGDKAETQKAEKNAEFKRPNELKRKAEKIKFILYYKITMNASKNHTVTH
jgi:hypothetical protein